MTKINLMPKNSWKTKAFKGLSIVAQVTLIFQMSSLGVFFVPQAQAAEIAIDNEETLTDQGMVKAMATGDITANATTPTPQLPTPVRNPLQPACGKPIEVMLTIDNSGSMTQGGNGEPLASAKTAAKKFVDLMNFNLSDPIATDRAGLTSYSTTAVLRQTLTDNKTAVKTAIDSLSSLNTTNIAGGVQTGQADIAAHKRAMSQPIMILLTDGIANIMANGTSCTTWPTAHTNCTVDAAVKANDAKTAGTVIYTIGYFTQAVQNQYPQSIARARETLQNMASDPAYYFETDSTANLESIYNQIKYQLCDPTLAFSKSVVNLTHSGATTVANPAQPGDILKYTLTASTTTQFPANNFIVSDDISDILQYATVTNPYTGTVTNGVITYPATNIAGNSSISKNFEVTIKPFAQWPQGGDMVLTNVYGNSIEVHVGQCQLIITKSVNKSSATVGETLTYTLNYTNTGTANCTGGGVEIYDALNSKLTFNGTHTQSVTGDTDGQGIDWAGGFNGTNPLVHAHVVSPNESGTITFQATINNPTNCGDFDIPNQAKIWSNETGNVLSNSVNTHVAMVCYGSLKVTKVVDTGENVRDNFSFTISPDPNNVGIIHTINGEYVFNNLPANSYTVTELPYSNYHQVSTTCTNVNVVPNQQATCEFHNARNTGNLTIIKQNEQQQRLPNIEFTIGSNTYHTNQNGEINLTNINTGNYQVEEIAPNNYTFSSVTGLNCTNSNPSTATVNYNKTTTCTFTNTRNTTKIYFDKIVVGGGPGIDSSWTFAVNGNGSFKDGDFIVLPTNSGPYAVTEDSQYNNLYTLTGASGACSLDNGNIVLNVGAQNGTCTVENTRNTGTLRIKKFNDLNANGIKDDGDTFLTGWHFDVEQNGQFVADGNTGDNGLFLIFEDLPTGTYDVTETLQAGWTNTTPLTQSAVVTKDQTTTKWFGNFEKVSVTACKKIDADGNLNTTDDQTNLAGYEVSLSVNGQTFDTQVTGENGCYTWTDLGPGVSYDVSEATSLDYTPLTPTTHDFGPAQSGETYSYTFINFNNINVTVCKYIDVNGDGFLTDEPPYQGWKVYLGQAEGITGVNGCYTFTNVGPGNYNVTEEVKDGWIKTYPTQNSYNFNAVSGQNETFNFGNFHLGKISGYKYDDLGNKLNDWQICLIGGGYTDGITDVDFGVTAINNCVNTGNGDWPDGYYEFNNISTGTYNLAETVQDNWRAITPASGQYTGLVITSGTTLAKDFVNQKKVYQINLTKTDTPDPVSPGAFITYTLNWSVGGNTKVTNLVLTDPLPTNTIFSSVANGGVYNDTTKTVTWNLGEKNPGDSGTVTFVVKALANLHNGTIITNTATLDSSETEPVTANANTTITSSPILNINKTVDLAYANPGNVVTYTVVVSNTGNETAYEVVLTDTLPAGFTFNPEGTATKSWSLGDLLPGASKTVNYSVNVGKSVIAGLYDNLAEASAKNHAKVSDKVTVEVRIPSILSEEAFPVLQLSKIVDKSSVNPNSLINYTVTIKNNGEATAYNVILTDKLPAGFTFTDTGLVEKTWKLGDMTPGSSITLNYEVLVGKDVKPGDYKNLATVKADNNDPITASVNVTVKQGVVLGITGPKWYEILYYLLGLLFVLGGIKSYQMIKKQEVRIK